MLTMHITADYHPVIEHHSLQLHIQNEFHGLSSWLQTEIPGLGDHVTKPELESKLRVYFDECFHRFNHPERLDQQPKSTGES